MKRWDIYLNLHQSCFSILARKTGRVASRKRYIVAGGVDFIVQPAGLRLAQKEGKKKPHAFVRASAIFPGVHDHQIYNGWAGDWVQVTYNPKKEGRWVLLEDRSRPVFRASMVICRMVSDWPEIYALGAA